MTGYNGVYYKKIEYWQWIQYDTVDQKGYFTVSWGSSGASSTTSAFIDDSQDFIDGSAFFQMWRVKGLKVTITPLSENNAGTSYL